MSNRFIYIYKGEQGEKRDNQTFFHLYLLFLFSVLFDCLCKESLLLSWPSRCWYRVPTIVSNKVRLVFLFMVEKICSHSSSVKGTLLFLAMSSTYTSRIIARTLYQISIYISFKLIISNYLIRKEQLHSIMEGQLIESQIFNEPHIFRLMMIK